MRTYVINIATLAKKEDAYDEVVTKNDTLYAIWEKASKPTYSVTVTVGSFSETVSVEENKINMIHAIDLVVVGQVTYAVKSTKVDGFDIKVNDIIGLNSKKILDSSPRG